MESNDILFADLETFTASLARNEEIGEKWSQFFVGLMTVIAGGLGALATSATLPAALMAELVGFASFFLLLIALLGYIRMLQRNLVTDQYKRTLDGVRAHIIARASLSGDLIRRHEVPSRFPPTMKILRGGYAEVMAVLSGVLTSTTLFFFSGIGGGTSSGVGTAAAVALLVLSNRLRAKTAVPRDQFFRAGVGAAIVDAGGKFLVFERSDRPGAWQLPQGGLREDEEPTEALYREVWEETRICRTELGEPVLLPEPSVYELEPRWRSTKTGRGQVHYWFVMRFIGQREIEPPPNGELRTPTWMSGADLLRLAAAFRLPAYRSVVRFAARLGTAAD